MADGPSEREDLLGATWRLADGEGGAEAFTGWVASRTATGKDEGR